MSDQYTVTGNRAGNKSVIERIRNPEYTGENRCAACTAVNLFFACSLTAGVAWTWSPAPAVVGFLAAVATIGLRGYLVPGTPTLTERYLPDRVLAIFDHQEAPPIGDKAVVNDVEETLIDGGILEPDSEGAELRLVPNVRDAWREQIESVEPDADVAPQLASVADVDAKSVVVDASDGGFAVFADDDYVGRWPSHAAFLADVTAADLLSNELADWQHFSRREQSSLLAGLRLFIAVCPACGGNPLLEQRTDDSCCRSRSVTAMVCDDCEARLIRVVGA